MAAPASSGGPLRLSSRAEARESVCVVEAAQLSSLLARVETQETPEVVGRFKLRSEFLRSEAVAQSENRLRVKRGWRLLLREWRGAENGT